MSAAEIITTHYTHGSLFEAISKGAGVMGKSVDQLSIDQLAAVDEFHIGGRVATQALLDQLRLEPGMHLLDVGCGIGGSSRFASATYNCQVTGVDLTQEYVDTGNRINQCLGLNSCIRLLQANATALPDTADTYDAAIMLHVGMNIEDKVSLAAEVFRVLRPGACLGIYDVMRTGQGDLEFPVPWAQESSGSFVSSPEDYKFALQQAGFTLEAERDRTAFALDFFQQLKAATANSGGPPALGLHILMGSTAAQKVKNMVGNISREIISPIELIARKPGVR